MWEFDLCGGMCGSCSGVCGSCGGMCGSYSGVCVVHVVHGGSVAIQGGYGPHWD